MNGEISLTENTRGVGHSKKIKEEVDLYFNQVLQGVYKITKSRGGKLGSYLTVSDIAFHLNSELKVAVEENTKVYTNYDLSHHEIPKRKAVEKVDWL